MTNVCPELDPVQFVRAEARLLNDARYQDWLTLFAADGHYWVPLAGDRQPDPKEHVSIAYEDRLLLATRIQRLQGARAHSLEPGARGLHVLQLPQIDAMASDGTTCALYTPFLYVETLGERQTMLAGVWRHQLWRTTGAWEIERKRVDLVNAAAAHEAIQLFP